MTQECLRLEVSLCEVPRLGLGACFWGCRPWGWTWTRLRASLRRGTWFRAAASGPGLCRRRFALGPCVWRRGFSWGFGGWLPTGRKATGCAEATSVEHGGHGATTTDDPAFDRTTESDLGRAEHDLRQSLLKRQLLHDGGTLHLVEHELGLADPDARSNGLGDVAHGAGGTLHVSPGERIADVAVGRGSKVAARDLEQRQCQIAVQGRRPCRRELAAGLVEDLTAVLGGRKTDEQ